jgi:branched-chain amino acid transport system substrate-binding protein
MVRCRWRRRNVRPLVSVMIIAGLALTACSSSTSSSSTAGSQAAGSSSEIIVGAFNNPTLAAEFGSDIKVAQWWASSVNAAGGINGHKIKLDVRTVGLATGDDLTATKALVAEHAVALLGTDLSDSTNYARYASSANLPIVGSGDVPQVAFDNYFPTETDSATGYFGIVQAAREYGAKMAVLYCSEISECAADAAIIKSLGPSVNEQVPVVAEAASSLPDYVGVCQLLISDHINSVFLALTAQTTVRVAEGCRQQGWKGVIILGSGSVIPSMYTQPSLQGAIAVDQQPPFFLDSTPAMKTYQALVRSQGWADTKYTFATYAATQLLAAGIKAAGADVTSASLATGLYTLSGSTLGGLTYPATYAPGKPPVTTCNSIWGIKDNAIYSPNNGAAMCATDSIYGQYIQPVINTIAKGFQPS